MVASFVIKRMANANWRDPSSSRKATTKQTVNMMTASAAERGIVSN
jgi:hypothetical protein